MIREAIIPDTPKISALMQMEPGFWPPWWSEGTIAAAIGSADGLAFVWEDGDQILGFVVHMIWGSAPILANSSSTFAPAVRVSELACSMRSKMLFGGEISRF